MKETRVRDLKIAGVGSVSTATTNEGKVVFRLKDVCKILNLNTNDLREEIGNENLVQITEDKRSPYYVEVVFLENFTFRSKEENADELIKWLKKKSNEANNTTLGIIPEDLSNIEDAELAMKTIKDYEIQIAVLKEELKKNKYKAKLADSVFGSVPPRDLKSAFHEIRYKGLTYSAMYEVLRANGVLDFNNVPHQKYIDEKYFRVTETIRRDKDEEIKITKTFVYQKGIRLIEEILKKKAGSKDER